MRPVGMLKATSSGTFFDDDGVLQEIIAGQTWWSSDDPDLQRPEVARLFGRSRGSRSVEATRVSRFRPSTRSEVLAWLEQRRREAKPNDSQHGQPEPDARPSWYLGSAEPVRRTDDELQRTARHEAAHAAAAYLLGWDVQRIRLHLSVGRDVQQVGHTDVRFPRDLDRTVRERQFATITLAARAHVGWTYDDAGANGISYRTDRKQAWEALARVGSDPRATSALYEQARAQAGQLAADSTFRFIARRVERELLEQGELRQPELGRLLGRAKLDAQNGRP